MKPKVAIALTALVLLLLGAGGAWWYVNVPLKHARWLAWHDANMGQVRAALLGAQHEAVSDAPDTQLTFLEPRYEVGVRKAEEAHEAWHKLQTQSSYTVKVLTVTVQVLKDGNDVGLDALREPLRTVFDNQHMMTIIYEGQQRDLKDVKQQLRVDWRKLWPDNKLDYVLVFPTVQMGADERAKANAVLADLTTLENANFAKYNDFATRRIPASDGTGSNLTPYEEDKYQAAWARKQLYEKLHEALHDAYNALGRNADDKAGK